MQNSKGVAHGNAVEAKPPYGAYTEAAKRLGLQRSTVQQGYKKGRAEIVNAVWDVVQEWKAQQREAENKKMQIAALVAAQ